ncbi:MULTISPECIES: hypothetical protein [unclassified Paenibacillus]|uniref:hypothetical protein n=1 Tax=unclassified Paenibacillus TaxID=185978 RepID=UPI0027852C3A|nr:MULTISPECIES: hypothetical protein [unclassified Paenibacillus]MDQ0896804.1 hypothetical protein [Paenibacillus sp. V4I7]MDQ0917048.1 hypothetical protein [Paenibacillus sp. V4I5]
MLVRTFIIIHIILFTGIGCSSQKEDQTITTVIDLFFNAIQEENNKLNLLKLTEKNSPAEKIFTDEPFYIGKLIEKPINILKANNKNAVVEVSFLYNDGFHSLDQGNHDSNEVIVITLMKKNNEWKILNVEKCEKTT